MEIEFCQVQINLGRKSVIDSVNKKSFHFNAFVLSWPQSRFPMNFNGSRIEAIVSTQDPKVSNPTPLIKRKGTRMEIQA